MHTIYYTVEVRGKYVMLVRGDMSWRIGSWTKANKLRFWSKKVDLFLDEEDIDSIQKLNRKNTRVGCVTILFKPLAKGQVAILAGACLGEPMSKWTELATWSASQGIRFGKVTHPAFRKDAFALAEVAKEAAGGSGVFHPNTPGDSSIFSNPMIKHL